MTNASLATIYALSSAPGRAGVAVIRMSGPETSSAILALSGSLPEPRRATVATFRDPALGHEIDRGFQLWLPAPASFTGEDCAEFHIHGGSAVIAALISALSSCPGCRLAEAGEFSRRAFENGKMDLAQAEGVADLIAAETEAQHQQALQQVKGRFSTLLEHWRTQLIEAAALTEAAIDFSDEADVADDAMKRARGIIGEVLPGLKAQLDDGHRGEILRDGFRVALVGAPNVGKSSLLNALARRDVAIVSAEAGTTRDVLEVHLDLAGYAVIISDTAGLRDHAGAIETEGIRRALAAANAAHLIVYLSDGEFNSAAPGTVPAEVFAGLDQGSILRVLNKADILSSAQIAEVKADALISAKTGDGLDRLIALIGERVSARLASGPETAVITQARHRAAIAQAAAALEACLSGPIADAELRAEDLRQAIAALGRITGRVDVEDILDQLFGRFCIGK